MLTPAGVRADVAAILYLSPDEVTDGENLFDAGLDSMRLMTLLEQWRAAGAEITFVDLAERPTLGDWLPLLVSRPQAVGDG